MWRAPPSILTRREERSDTLSAFLKRRNGEAEATEGMANSESTEADWGGGREGREWGTWPSV